MLKKKIEIIYIKKIEELQKYDKAYLEVIDDSSDRTDSILQNFQTCFPYQ